MELFQEYFKYGGMPFTLELNSQQKIDYLMIFIIPLY